MNKIPTYAANRQRRRRYSLVVIERLLAEGKVSVDRNSRGEITAAMFLPVPEREAKPRCRTAVSTGTYYSHEVTLAPGLPPLWQHKDLLRLSELDTLMGHRVEDPADVDRFLTTIFRAVPISCLSSLPKPRAVIRKAINCSLGPEQTEALQHGWKKRKVLSRS